MGEATAMKCLCTTMESSPCSPQLEKAHALKERARTGSLAPDTEQRPSKRGHGQAAWPQTQSRDPPSARRAPPLQDARLTLTVLRSDRERRPGPAQPPALPAGRLPHGPAARIMSNSTKDQPLPLPMVPPTQSSVPGGINEGHANQRSQSSSLFEMIIDRKRHV